MLPEEKISKYRSELLRKRKELMGELKGSENPEDFGHDVDGFDEETDESEAYSNQVAFGQSIKDRVNEIDNALNRIEDGSYGLCTKCDRIISDKLLDLVPETELCEVCKKEER